MTLATLQMALGIILFAAMFARGARAQAAAPQLCAFQHAGPIGGGATVGTCGTISVGGLGDGARPMRDYRRAGALHHAVVGGFQQLAALDAASVGALDGIVLACPGHASGTPYHTLAGLMPPEGCTFELHVALQRFEATARANRLGRTEYMVLRKHLIETMAGQQQAFAGG